MGPIYGYVYKTTNLINGKQYIGLHKGSRLDGGYYGSGVYLTKALKKYGKKNFKCDLVDTAYSLEELEQKEKFWIDFFNAVDSDNFYNLIPGGACHELDLEVRHQLSIFNKGKKMSQETKDKISKSNKGKHCGDKNSAKLPQSRAKLKIKNHGKNNPVYGRHWYTDGNVVIYTYTCPEGFVPGRNRKSNGAKGRHWYNNGVDELLSVNCPEGYTEGRLKK